MEEFQKMLDHMRKLAASIQHDLHNFELLSPEMGHSNIMQALAKIISMSEQDVKNSSAFLPSYIRDQLRVRMEVLIGLRETHQAALRTVRDALYAPIIIDQLMALSVPVAVPEVMAQASKYAN